MSEGSRDFMPPLVHQVPGVDEKFKMAQKWNSGVCWVKSKNGCEEGFE